MIILDLKLGTYPKLIVSKMPINFHGTGLYLGFLFSDIVLDSLIEQ